MRRPGTSVLGWPRGRNFAVTLAACLLGILCFLALQAYSHRASRAASDITRVFRDFEYVGYGEGGYNLEKLPALRKGDLQAKSLPAKLESGRQFVFIRPKNQERGAAFELLLARLSEGGVTVEKDSCCMMPYVGDPIFTIWFRDGKHRGVIYNTFSGAIAFDEELSAKYDSSYYVLVIEEQLR